jgi:hypothetical protein
VWCLSAPRSEAQPLEDPPQGHPSSPHNQRIPLQGGGSITIHPDGTLTLRAPDLNGGAATKLHPDQVATAPSFAGGSNFGSAAAVLERMGPAAGLSVSDFGLWNARSPSGLGPPHFFAGGRATPSNQLPRQGAGITATYNGLYIANLEGSANFEGRQLSPGPFNGNVSITANFDTQKLNAAFTGLLQPMVSVTSSYNPANGTYQIGGSTLSNFAAGTMTMQGQFVGKSSPTQAPPETAGLMSGNLGAPGAAFAGSFGAHR